MKKQRHFYRFSLLTATLLPLITGCVTDQDFRGLEMQVRSMDNRLVEMERNLDELQRGAGTSVKIMQKQQADMGGSLDRVNTELLQVKGQLDETRHRYRSLQSENKRLEGKLSTVQEISESQALELKERLGNVETSASEFDNRLANVRSNLTALQEKQAKADTIGPLLTAKVLTCSTGPSRKVSRRSIKTSISPAPATSSDSMTNGFSVCRLTQRRTMKNTATKTAESGSPAAKTSTTGQSPKC